MSKRKYIVLVNGKSMKTSSGDVYEFESIKQAIQTVTMCYGLDALRLGGDVEIVDAEEVGV